MTRIRCQSCGTPEWRSGDPIIIPDTSWMARAWNRNIDNGYPPLVDLPRPEGRASKAKHKGPSMHVKITGDASSLVKALEDASHAARSFDFKIGQARRGRIRRAWRLIRATWDVLLGRDK